MRWSLVCSAVLFSSLPAIAQQRPPVVSSLTETIDVSLVNVDVFVTDKAGNRIHGLKKDDFEIFENGVKQPISNFSEYSSTATPAAAPEVAPQRAASTLQKRSIILFFDRIFLLPDRNKAFFDSLRKLLHDSVKPGDRVMIVTFNRGVLVNPLPFTDSMPAIDRALAGVEKMTGTKFPNVLADIRFMVDFAQGFDDQAVAAGASSEGSGIAEMTLMSIAQLEKQELDRKVQAINAVIRTVAATEGKKIMIVVPHRLSRVAGAGAFSATGRNVRGIEQLENRAALDMANALKSIDLTANANGVTVYPLFPEGLESSLLDAADAGAVTTGDYETLSNEMQALQEIAEETGGLTAWGADTTKLIPRVAEDLESYYSVAYRVKSTGADKSRHITVKTKDPALVVRMRRDFMEKSDQTRMEDRVIAALFHNPPSPGFPLNVSVGRPRPRSRQMLIPLKINIPISALTQLPDGRNYSGAFSVYFAWGGTLGGISETSHQTRPYSIPAEKIREARASGHLTYDIDLGVDNRTERIAFGVVDEISKEYALRLMELPRR
jgi:VWFA-related protein